MEGIEFYWEIVSRLADIAETMLEGNFLCRFVRPFLKRKAAAQWAGIVYFAVILFLWLTSCELRYTDICGMAAAFVVMYLFDRRNAAQKIFLSAVMCLLFWLEYGFALIPWNACFELVLLREYMQDKELLRFLAYIMVQVLHCVLQGILLHFMVKLVHRVYGRKEEDVTKKELVLLLSPLLLVLAGRFVLAFAVETYLEDTGQYLWNAHGEFQWLKVLYQMISFLTVLFTVMVYQKIREAQQREKEDAVLAEQAVRLKQHISEAEKLYGKMRGLRHDMGNHVTVLENLFLKNEGEELRRYFRKLREEFLCADADAAVDKMGSGSPVTDIILAEKKRQAQEAGIEFINDFRYPDGWGLNAFDVSVILDNSLTNAIEAAKSAPFPYVKVRSWHRKNVFMAEVENRFSGRLEFDGEDALPRSTKQDAGGHGFGLANIRRVARKYCGDVDMVQEGECVRLSVMLMFPMPEGDGMWEEEKGMGDAAVERNRK